MPDEEIRVETDGDPSTEYEDTEAHSRTGFIANEPDRGLMPEDAKEMEDEPQ